MESHRSHARQRPPVRSNKGIYLRILLLTLLGSVAATALAAGDGHIHALPPVDVEMKRASVFDAPFIPQALREATQNLGAAAQYGQWSDVQSWPVVAIHTNLLPNGKVLAWDATPDDSDDNPHTTSSFTTRVSLYDPISNTHVATNNDTNSDLFCAGSAHLWDGRILFAGGDSGTSGSNAPLENTNIYHYKTNSWRRVTNMATPRWYASVAALANGEMLTFAGAYEPSPVAEVFQFNETWRSLSIDTPYLFPDLYQWLQTTPEGTVLSFGPQNTIATIDTDAGGLWTTGPQRDEFDIRAYGSYAMYDIGKILVSGGGDRVVSTDSSVLIETATQQTTTTGSMNHKRTQHDLTILADGTVLALGGNNDGTYLYSESGGVYTPEIWSPESGQWRVMNDMQVDRQYHSTALLLPDGRVLSAGGGICGDCNRAGYREQNAEIFAPPYLFSSGNVLAERPVITTAPGEMDYAKEFLLSTTQDTQIEKIHLIKLGAATHSQNQDQRLVPLDFTAQGNQLRVRAPDNRNIAPPGHYMLIAVNRSGVPSVAKIVLVGQPLVNSGDVVVNSLLAGEHDVFLIESTEADTEVVFTLDGLTANATLELHTAESIYSNTAALCSVTVAAGERVECRQPNRVATHWYGKVLSAADTNYTLAPLLIDGRDINANYLLSGTDSVSDRVALGGWNYYEITPNSGQSELEISLSELSADADLYVQRNERPNGTADDGGDFYCASYLTASNTDSCTISNVAGSNWIVGVYGFREATYRLSSTATIAPLEYTDIGLAAISIDVQANQWAYYSVSEDSRGGQLSVELSDLSADLDLYLRRDGAPRQSVEQWGVYDCASFAGAQTDERCIVEGAIGSKWIVGIYGYQAASATLRVSRTSGAVLSPVQLRLGKAAVLTLKNSSAEGGTPVSSVTDNTGEVEGGAPPPADPPTATPPTATPTTNLDPAPGESPAQSPPGTANPPSSVVVTGGGAVSPLFWLSLFVLSLITGAARRTGWPLWFTLWGSTMDRVDP